MRNKWSAMWVVFLLPLVLGWGVARAADQNVSGFKVTLADGSLVNGAASVVISLDTPYGQIRIPSESLVSAKFDAQNKTADIQLNDAQMKLKYNPATSDVKATTSAGTLTIALAKVTQVTRGSPQIARAVSPQAPAIQNPAQTQPGVAPPATETQQAPVVTAPPAIVYPYYQSYQQPYQYATAAPYYDPSYYYYQPYYQPYYNYWSWPYVGWPYFGFSIGVGWDSMAVSTAVSMAASTAASTVDSADPTAGTVRR